MTNQAPDTSHTPERAVFTWEAAKISESDAQKRVLAGQVSIGGRKYNVTVGYNEEVLRETYNLDGADPSELEATIKAIIENISPEDIIAMSGSKVTTDHQTETARVLHSGKEYTLEQLTDDPSEKLKTLAATAQRVIQAFSATHVIELIQLSKLPTSPLSFELEELSESPPASPAPERLTPKHKAEAEVVEEDREAEELLPKVRVDFEEVLDFSEEEPQPTYLKYLEEADSKEAQLTTSEEQTSGKLSQKDSKKPWFLNESTAVSIVKKEILLD